MDVHYGLHFGGRVKSFVLHGAERRAYARRAINCILLRRKRVLLRSLMPLIPTRNARGEHSNARWLPCFTRILSSDLPRKWTNLKDCFFSSMRRLLGPLKPSGSRR